MLDVFSGGTRILDHFIEKVGFRLYFGVLSGNHHNGSGACARTQTAPIPAISCQIWIPRGPCYPNLTISAGLAVVCVRATLPYWWFPLGNQLFQKKCSKTGVCLKTHPKKSPPLKLLKDLDFPGSIFLVEPPKRNSHTIFPASTNL